MTDVKPLGGRAFTRGRIGALELRNRIIKTATYEGMIHQGLPTQMLLEHHRELARGGVGMTTIAYCAVSPNGRTFEQQMYMREETVPHLLRLTDAVHFAGAKVSLQLGHCGYFTKNKALSWSRPRGPSPTWNFYGFTSGLARADAMTEEDIENTVQEFAQAARLAKQAGFDAVEIHLGHGYLLSQFISPLLNQRRDRYGGSLENRLRFARMVIEKVRAAVGSEFAILGKLNVSDGVKGGVTAEQAAEAAQLLEAAGISALVLSGGLVDRSALYLLRGERPLKQMIEVEKSRPQKIALAILGTMLIRAYPFEPLFFLNEARVVRNAVKIPLVLLGGVTSLAHIETALEEGFDFVAMGRALIHDPHLIRKFHDGEAQTSGCHPCNQCITEMDRPGGVCCAQQPAQLVARAVAVTQGLHEQSS